MCMRVVSCRVVSVVERKLGGWMDGQKLAYRLGKHDGADHAGASVAHLAGRDEVIGHVDGKC